MKLIACLKRNRCCCCFWKRIGALIRNRRHRQKLHEIKCKWHFILFNGVTICFQNCFKSHRLKWNLFGVPGRGFVCAPGGIASNRGGYKIKKQQTLLNWKTLFFSLSISVLYTLHDPNATHHTHIYSHKIEQNILLTKLQLSCWLAMRF